MRMFFETSVLSSSKPKIIKPPIFNLRAKKNGSGIRKKMENRIATYTHIGNTSLTPVESKTRTYHERVASGRTARQRGETGQTERRQNSSPRGQASLVPAKAPKPSFLNIFPEARTSEIVCKPVDSKTRTYHERVGSGRTAGRRGGARQDETPTEQFAQETSVPRTPQGNEDTSPERLSRSTNK